MTRRKKNEEFTAVCEAVGCNRTYETTISTKRYCSWECAKKMENLRRYERQKSARANAKQAAE